MNINDFKARIHNTNDADVVTDLCLAWLKTVMYEKRCTSVSVDYEKPCTCHPDDNPPSPCAKQYALSECKSIAGVNTDGVM